MIDIEFRGIETERIRFEATEDTTAAEFAAAPTELRRRLEDFVGKENYLLDDNACPSSSEQAAMPERLMIQFRFWSEAINLNLSSFSEYSR